jgi:N-acetylglucosamine kinase-like BadF-type ATPase
VPIFLGIDAGGSKTTCVVGDEKNVLASATAGGSNLTRVDESVARHALHESIRRASAAADVDPGSVERVCLGMAGAGRPQVSELARRIVAEVIPGKIEVVGDNVITLHAAFVDGVGVVVIAGTGSIAYGRTRAGQTARAGGWGFAISDEGSGYWIGRSAVSLTLRAHDEGEPSALLQAINKAWNVRSIDELVKMANGTPPPDFPGLVAAVLGAADTGDALARTLLTQAGTELARLAKIVMARLFPDSGNVPVAMSGGVFRNSQLLRQVFYNSLRSEYPNAVINSAVVDPWKGALELARKAAG